MWTVHSFSSVSSTQDVARQYLAEGRPLPFAILADEQTAGRGRSGNQWISPPAGNLYSSICPKISPEVPLRDAGQYSFLTAVSLQETLAVFGVASAQNKWPNDILVDGRKIAGILIESNGNAQGNLGGLIIGVGVNLAAAPAGAVSLGELIGASVSPQEFLASFLDHLQAEIGYYSAHGFAPLRQKWLAKAYGLGLDMRVRLPHESFTGKFIGLDTDGSLLVLETGRENPRRVYSGEVFFEQSPRV